MVPSEVRDRVIVPSDLPVGEYLLSWRWDCYMADQVWSNCADVTITDTASSTETTTSSTTSVSSSTSSTSSSNSGCVNEELPTEWSQAGRFDCSYFRDRGAAYTNPLAYCAHAAIRNACCFCQSAPSARRQKRKALRRGYGTLLIQSKVQTKREDDEDSEL